MCSHEKTEYRKRGNAIYAQCVNCGDSVGSAVARSNFHLHEIDALRPFDDELRESYWKDESARRKVASEREEKEKREAWFVRYNEYLNSMEWRARRAKVLQRDNYTCQACLVETATQVHHTTYDRVFREPLFDLQSVCDECHESIHKTK